MKVDDAPKPGRLMRFVRWRRDSGGWVYFWMVASWAVLTFVVVDLAEWPWHAYATSAVIFILLFEVGLSHLWLAAVGSHRWLEKEGEDVDEPKQTR